eukprot:1600878-Pleurochrysis_carterae.AAC.3
MSSPALTSMSFSCTCESSSGHARLLIVLMLFGLHCVQICVANAFPLACTRSPLHNPCAVINWRYVPAIPCGQEAILHANNSSAGAHPLASVRARELICTRAPAHVRPHMCKRAPVQAHVRQ